MWLIVEEGRTIPASVATQPQANRAERRRAFVPGSASVARSLLWSLCTGGGWQPRKSNPLPQGDGRTAAFV